MILVVDDEAGVLQLCQRLLVRAGHTVLTASTSDQALAFLSQERLSLLLADIRMPGKSGFQLMDLARSRQPDISVILMTGYGTVDIAIEALHRGADGLILKPFEGSELVRSVEKALDESQRRRDSARLRVLRPLFDITKTFFSETQPEKLWQLILEAVCSHLLCSNSAIIQRDSSGYQNMESCGKLLDQEITSYLGTLAETVVDLSHGLKIDLLDVSDDYPAEIVQALSACDLRSLLFGTIPYKNREILLFAGRNRNEAPFQEADLEMLVILARQASAALENAILYEELRASMEWLERSQKALLQAEKIAAAGRLTASIAHEINNPLQSLSNCLHLVGRSELSPDVRQNYLMVAQNELDRLMLTVQRMLDLFRPGAKDRQWTNLENVIERVLALLEPQLQKSSIYVHKKYISPSPLILAVTDQIQQVILNLLLNSIEAMPAGGEIFIWTSPGKEGLEIIIEDTGSGIPEVEQGRIFEPFISTKENGTGLGLAVSYGIIQAHGGNLELLPDHGKGACFRILLPTGGKG